MKRLAAIVLLTMPIINFSQQLDPINDLSIFNWLSGTWEHKGDKSITIEKWEKISPSTFEGKNYVRKINDQEPNFSESLRLVSMKGEVFYLAELKNQKALFLVAPDMSVAWKSLDVAVLHKLILEQLLGIDESKLASQSNIDYIKDTAGAIDDSIENVDNGQKQVAFFMNPPKMEQIQDVAAEGETMPQKSTYFYPKIFTGLTIYKL